MFKQRQSLIHIAFEMCHHDEYTAQYVLRDIFYPQGTKIAQNCFGSQAQFNIG